jgi:hypothetical protein
MVEEEHIDLVDDNNRPFLQKQLTELMNNQAGTGEADDDGE